MGMIRAVASGSTSGLSSMKQCDADEDASTADTTARHGGNGGEKMIDSIKKPWPEAKLDLSLRPNLPLSLLCFAWTWNLCHLAFFNPLGGSTMTGHHATTLSNLIERACFLYDYKSPHFCYCSQPYDSPGRFSQPGCRWDGSF